MILLTLEDDIRFYIAEKVAISDNPVKTINVIMGCLLELKEMYLERERIKGEISDIKRSEINQ